MPAKPRSRHAATLAGGVVAGVLAGPLAPAWAAEDDRLLLVEQSVWRAEVRQADGGRAVELYAGAPQGDALARGGSWLPDSSGVVLLDQPEVAAGRPGTPSIVVVARDGSTRRTVVQGGITGHPDVSPDGVTVAFPADDQVQTVDLSGANRRPLATVSEGFGVGAVAWAPDGRSVAMLVVADSTGDTSVWRVDAAATSATQLSDPAERVAGYGVSWSPDSASLAYAVQTEDGDTVKVVGPGGRRSLTAGREPAWSPDGASIALVEGERLRVVDAASGQERVSGPTSPGCSASSPTWTPDSASVAFSFAFSSSECPSGEARVLDVAAGTTRSVPGVPASQHGYALDFAPLPTRLPAQRATTQACPDGRVPEDGFADTESSIFESDIDCVTWWGLARGNGSGYAPAAPVTRAQTALLLTRLMTEAGVPHDTADPGFTDTAGLSTEARNAVNAVANAQVARGTSPSTFSPGLAVTRGQLASFLVRLQGVLEVPLPGRVRCFADTWSSVHREPAERLCAAGVALGDGAGSFGPGTPVTRGQVAGLLARTLDLGVEAGRLAPPTS